MNGYLFFSVLCVIFVTKINSAEPVGSISVGKLVEELGCFGCHISDTPDTKRGHQNWRFDFSLLENNPAYLFNYLKNPIRIRKDIGFSRMPNFKLNDKESLALTLFLIEQSHGTWENVDGSSDQKADQRELPYINAKNTFPEITVKTGEMIFKAQNCIACHQIAGDNNILTMAPSLTNELSRVKTQWLREYLKKPTPIRPFGFLAGSGGRMPDFGLSGLEVEAIIQFLAKRNKELKLSFSSKKLSAFSMQKARILLSTKLSCLGCHWFGKEGGAIGPNLSHLSKRLNQAYIFSIIKAPQTAVPGTIMPKIKMPKKELELIVNFLIQQETASTQFTYPSLTDFSPIFPNETRTGKNMYLRYCSPCHGVKGDGRGYNASFLPVKPTNHTDSASMSLRPNDTLFDGIYAGGYILGKSIHMPPWGETLTANEILLLVRYLRELCQCKTTRYTKANQ